MKNIIITTKKLFENFINQNLHVRLAYVQFIQENPYLLYFKNKDVIVPYQSEAFLSKTLRNRLNNTQAMNRRIFERYKKTDGSYYIFEEDPFSTCILFKDDLKHFTHLELAELSQDYYSEIIQSLNSLVLVSKRFKEWFITQNDYALSFRGIDKEEIDLSLLEAILEQNQEMIELQAQESLRYEEEMKDFFEKNPDFASLYYRSPKVFIKQPM